MPASAFLFDMGGTLFDYRDRDRMRQPVRDAFSRMGMSSADHDVLDAWAAAREEVEIRYSALPAFAHRDLFRDRVVVAARRLGVEPDPSVLSAFDDEQREAIVDSLVLRPDAYATLAELRARGVYCAVVSNADDDYLSAVLGASGIDALLDDCTSSEEAWSCKPDPGIFSLALQKAGVPARDAVFVGDSPQHDIAGAHAAGMVTVLIGDDEGPAPLSRGLPDAPAPDHRISELSELLGLPCCPPERP